MQQQQKQAAAEEETITITTTTYVKIIKHLITSDPPLPSPYTTPILPLYYPSTLILALY
jgi:hypothetical protein